MNVNVHECSPIQKDFNDALQEDLQFPGALSFYRSYPNAPNPCLRVSDIGGVGLPLSTRDAEAIKAAAASGQQSTESEQRASWHLEASKLAFDNMSRWSQFLAHLSGDIRVALGIAHPASSLKYNLRGLLINSTNQRPLLWRPPPAKPPVICTILVVLPSYFVGGTLHMSYGGSLASYDCSIVCKTETRVVGWYADIKPDMSPIIAGNFVGLLYDLCLTELQFPEKLDPKSSALRKIRRIFYSWVKNPKKSSPSRLFHLLESTYTPSSLASDGLHALDSPRVDILAALARQYGLHTAFAEFVITVSGRQNDCLGESCGCGRHQNAPGSSQCSSSQVKYEEIGVEVGRVFDLTGEPLPHRYVAGADGIGDVMVFAKRVALNRPFDREEHVVTEQGEFTRLYYHCAIMVIWPDYYDYLLRYGEEAVSKACIALSSSSRKPTATEQTLVRFLLRRFEDDRWSVMETLCQAAYRWCDASLWARAIKICGVGGMPDEEQVYDACALLGFGSVKSVFEKLLRRHPVNFSRFQLLDHIQQWAQDHPSDGVNAWLTSQRSLVLQSLRVPYVDEDALFISLASEWGGLKFLEEAILPQIIPLAGDEFLLKMASSIYYEPTYTDSEVKNKLVASLLDAAVLKLSFCHAQPHDENQDASPPQRIITTYLEKTKKYLNLAVALRKLDTLGDVVKKILESSPSQENGAKLYMLNLLLPVFCFLDQQPVPDGCTSPFPAVEELRERIVSGCMKALFVNTSLTKDELFILIETLLPTSGLEEFASSVKRWLYVSRPDIIPNLAEVLALVVEMILNSKASDPDAGLLKDKVDGILRPLILTIVKRYAMCIPLPNTTAISDAMEFCLRYNSVVYASHILDRAVKHSSENPLRYVADVLVPLIPTLRELAVRHGLLHIWGYAFRDILLAWKHHKLRSAPGLSSIMPTIKSIAAWPCRCLPCMEVCRFLTEASNKSLTLRSIGSKARKHIQAFLEKYVGFNATWSTVKTNPQGLQIIKSDPIHTFIVYQNITQAEGREILRAISPHNHELQQILGNSYQQVVSSFKAENRSHIAGSPAKSLIEAMNDGSALVQATAAEHLTVWTSMQGEPLSKKRKLMDD